MRGTYLCTKAATGLVGTIHFMIGTYLLGTCYIPGIHCILLSASYPTYLGYIIFAICFFPSGATFLIPTYLGYNCTLLSGTHATYLGYIAHCYHFHIYIPGLQWRFATRYTGYIPRLHCTLLSGTLATYLGYHCTVLSSTQATYLGYFAHCFLVLFLHTYLLSWYYFWY